MELIFIAVLVMTFFLIELVFYKFFLLKNMEYTLSFSQKHAFENDDMYVDEVIYNKKPIYIPWVKADIHSSKWLEFANASSVIIDERRFVTSGFMLKAFQKTTRRWYMKCTKRGVFDIDNATLTCGDLLGLVTESKAVPVKTRLTVYPGLVDLSETFFSTRDIMGDAIVKRFIIDDPFIVKGTREYMPGDAINRINWKATARHDRLMVKENDFTAKMGITVLMNIQSADNEFNMVKNKDVVELAIKVSATILNRGYSTGMPLRFATNGCVVDRDDEMVFSEIGNGQEHYMELLTVLAQLKLKNVRDFPIFVNAQMENIRNTQVYIVTAYYNEDILGLAREMQKSSNTVKVLVLDTYSDGMPVSGDIETYFMGRK
ncbi:MAG: DUF58 domain-containing protein [Clostridia bacterium]